MQPKWISSSSHRESSSVPKVRPGAFSNQPATSKQSHEPHNSRSGRTYHIPDQKRLNKNKSASNTYFGTSNDMNSENEPYLSMLENNGPSMISEQYYQHHNMSSQPLAEKSNNQIQGKESRSHSQSHPGKSNTNEKQNKGSADENSYNKQNQQGSYVKILQHSQSLSKNRESSNRSPLSYSKRKMTPAQQAPGTSSRKATRPQTNDENISDLSQPKVMRSHSSLALTGATDGKSQGNNMHHRSSEGFFAQEQHDAENMQRLMKENQELWKNVDKLTVELQNEKKKCAVMEGEAENFKNDLVKERDRYKEELCKISLQIKKLRNIQNIYVTEKKNSEKLENQLNLKEKVLGDTSHLLCESLKSMVNVLELVLLKGDVALDKHWKARDFNPEMMFKLFNDIRKQLLPKVEEAEGYDLEFEWKSHDYRDIMTHTKEFLKLKKTASSKGLNTQKEYNPNPNQKEMKAAPLLPPHYLNNNSDNANNTIFSPVFAQAAEVSNNFIPNTNVAVDMPKKINEPEIYKPKPPVNDISSRDKIASKSLNDLQAQLQKINDYVPLHARMSMAEIKMQEEIQEEEDNTNVIQNQSLEVIQEDRCIKKRASSVSKCWEDPAENLMAGSLGSTIAPRTNNCSGFADAFEHFLGENPNSKINSEDKRANMMNNNKNYDLPIAASSVLHNVRASNELEAAKNKILKTKQNIEARRASYDPNFALEQQQGIIEISDESTTSFQKTLEDDSMQRHSHNSRNSHKETTHHQQHQQPDHNDNYQQGFALKMNKAPSQPVINKDSGSKEQKMDSSSSRKDDMPRLTRSSSNVTVSADDGQKSSNRVQQAKKEQSQRSLTPDTQSTQREAPPTSKDESSERKVQSGRGSSEHFVTAKFDYNAQKDNDLSFSQGDKIKILRKTETGWWIGLCNNKIGYFPSNFVEVGENS